MVDATLLHIVNFHIILAETCPDCTKYTFWNQWRSQEKTLGGP